MLKLKNNKLLAYGGDFVFFLIERGNFLKEINRIILFGSVVRDEASKDSDIDIFIDVLNNKKNIEKEVKKINSEFINSKKYQDYWLLKGITNEINVIVGELNKWKDIKNSIISNGITIYGKFEDNPEKGEHKTILSWENVKPESKRVLLSKRLFGYKKGKKTYEGLVKKFKGERIGKGIILVPSISSNLFLKIFREMKVTVRLKKIIEYR